MELMRQKPFENVEAGKDVTGKGADTIIIDDPVRSTQDASSPQIKKTAWD